MYNGLKNKWIAATAYKYVNIIEIAPINRMDELNWGMKMQAKNKNSSSLIDTVTCSCLVNVLNYSSNMH